MHEPLPRRVAAVVTHDLHRDFETRSAANLAKVGAHKYAADPSTTIWCAAYAVNNDPVKLWFPGDPVPPEWTEAARNPSWRLTAHNDPFESAIEQHILGPRFGFPLVPLERHDCTMARCQRVGLPAKLETVADVLELTHRKDLEGHRLMLQMSKPHPTQTFGPQHIQRLGTYCVIDVEVEREVDGEIPKLSAIEHAVWVLNCRINTRGFPIIRSFAEAARQIIRAAAPELDAEIAELTGGAVTKVSQVKRLRQWLQRQGHATTGLDREVIEKLLGDATVSSLVRRVLELRLGGAQAAVKKFDALFACADDDDRIRGVFRYHGAGTGRFSAERFQPQNMKKFTVEDPDAAIAAVATGDIEQVKKLYPRPLAIVGQCTRPTIGTTRGHLLRGIDLSAIESRVLAWVAVEEWKLEAFRQFDATQDPRLEPYLAIVCKMHGVPQGTYSRESPERGLGKLCDLSFGFQGGLNAFRKFSDQFTDDEVLSFRDQWRFAHPKAVEFWYALNRATVNAVRERGRVFRCGRIELQYAGAALQLRLPSGRALFYPRPRITLDKFDNYAVVFLDNKGGRFADCRGGEGVYGGLLTENVVSGIARDLLTDAMLRIESAGYPIVLHVHDEIVVETPDDFGSEREFIELMTRTPHWAGGLPIAAKAWSGSRYIK